MAYVYYNPKNVILISNGLLNSIKTCIKYDLLKRGGGKMLLRKTALNVHVHSSWEYLWQ